MIRYIIWVVLLLVGMTYAAESKPNVIVILSDDQGWGDYGIHGNREIDTPNLDALARSGALFERFYVCSVCAPTRAEFLTGRHFTKTGVYGVSEGAERLDEDETLISEVFKRAGYKTAVFGKWHNGSQYPYHPNHRGFDEFYGFTSGHWATYFSPILDHNGEIVKGNGYLTDDLTDRAMSYIETHRASPFFVYLAYQTPHSPMQVPDRWWNKYKDKEFTQEFLEKKKQDVPHTRAAYAMCENIDWNVGRLLEKLDQLELAENTIVLYFNDNGPNGRRWNGGMRGRKGTIDEGGVRSALFVRWPGKIKAGSRVSQMAAGFDLLPTLADLSGITVTGTKPLDGVSLKPLLMGESTPWPERTFYHFMRNQVSVRTPRYRLDGKGRLYDMTEDEGQQNPINEQHPKVAAELKAKAEKWLQKTLVNYGPEHDQRPFVIGHPAARVSQVPARDGNPQGGIQRSNRFPNASYFTQWTSTEGSITWNGEVGQSGRYLAEVLYSCPEPDIGARVELSFNGSRVTGKVTKAHDPPLIGMEHDRVKRKESYTKDWGRMILGEIELQQGSGTLKLQALDVPGSQVMDFRALLLTRIE
jgi:arylsulfatase A-like enzyme